MEQILAFLFGIIVCYLAVTGWSKLQSGRKILAGPPKPSPEEQKKKAEKDKAEKAKGRRQRLDGLILIFVCALLIAIVILIVVNSLA